MRSYATYSVEDKRKMIQYIKEQGTSIRETATFFNLSTPSRWSSLEEEIRHRRRRSKIKEKGVTDITASNLFGEKLYVSRLLDLFHREIVTYTVGSRPVYFLVSQMLG